jgi:Glycosyl transferase family 2
MCSTVLTNIYNEEYLLPYWLEHHKSIFDHGIIIDYRSTDRSVQICKEICPTWEVRTSVNPTFSAIEIDAEFMDIEKSLGGIKVILNTTEFLYIDKPLSLIFEGRGPCSLGVRAYGPYSLQEEYPTTLRELEMCVLKDDVVFGCEYTRGRRQVHTFPTGNYGLGRHTTYNPSKETDNLAILWLGYFPWNQQLIDRKLQIKQNIPESDVHKGYGYHHFYDVKKLQTIREEWCRNGRPLQEVCQPLYKMLRTKT